MKILNHLPIWIVVSIVVHLILFRFLRFESTQVVEGKQKYEVKLLYYAPRVQMPVLVPKSAPKKAKPRSRKREEKPAPVEREVKKEDKEPMVHDTVVETENTFKQREEESAIEMPVYTAETPVEITPSRDLLEVIEGLRRSIMEHQVYPPAAKKRSLQGVVVLWLELDTAGNLVELRVNQSSGHPILDRAAQALVKKVMPYEHGTGRSVGIEIPIKYSLVP